MRVTQSYNSPITHVEDKIVNDPISELPLYLIQYKEMA